MKGGNKMKINSNMLKTLAIVIGTGIIAMVQSYQGCKQEEEFEDMKNRIAELEEKVES